jgi:hypothetical protein
MLPPPHGDEEAHQLHDLVPAPAAGRAAAPVEMHLLVCEECRERLAAWDQYVGAMRAVLLCLSDRAQQAFFGR